MSDYNHDEEDIQNKGVIIHDTFDGVIGLLCVTTQARRMNRYNGSDGDVEEDEFDSPTPLHQSIYSWLRDGYLGTLEQWENETPSKEEVKYGRDFFKCFGKRNRKRGRNKPPKTPKTLKTCIPQRRVVLVSSTKGVLVEWLKAIRKKRGRNDLSIKSTDPDMVELLDFLRETKSPLTMTFGDYIESWRQKCEKRELTYIRLFNKDFGLKPLYDDEYVGLKDIQRVRDIPMFFILFYGRQYIPKCIGGHDKALSKMIEFVRADGADIVG